MKNKILKGLFVFCLVSTILAGCAVDSESPIPLIICYINAVYLFLFTIANSKR